jgi:hypothetical protein
VFFFGFGENNVVGGRMKKEKERECGLCLGLIISKEWIKEK